MRRPLIWCRRRDTLVETYNIGGHNEKQNIQIIHIIIGYSAGDAAGWMIREKQLVSEDLITYVADRKGHDRRYAIAPDKIKAEIGWEPETMFEEGIQQDDRSGSSSMRTG